MIFLNKSLTVFVIRAVLSFLILIDVWTDIITLGQIKERLFEECKENLTETLVVVDLEALENELLSKCNITINMDQLATKNKKSYQETNDKLDKARVTIVYSSSSK